MTVTSQGSPYIASYPIPKFLEQKIHSLTRAERDLLSPNNNPDNSDEFFSSVIKFKAKPTQYKRYINQIKDCLQTIKWNDKVTMVL